jgi:hypothetical protein
MSFLYEHGEGVSPWTARRCDYGNYQIEDTFQTSPTTAVCTWSYPPFGAFTQADGVGLPTGDGGEQYEVRGDGGSGAAVFINCTLDGSSPAVQQFGSDWLLFRTDADSAGWKETQSPTGKFTRYIRMPVTFPYLGTVETIVSEHYSGPNAALSPEMERIFFVKGLGRVCWQAWKRTGSPVSPDRAPDFGWNTLTAEWVLTDTRLCVVPITTAPVNGAILWKP